MTLRFPEPHWTAIDFARADLEAVQEREPLHARVYADGLAFCSRCPSRRDCAGASMRLAVQEVRKIGA